MVCSYLANRNQTRYLQRYQLLTISKYKWRLAKAVMANIEGVCGGVHGGIPSPIGVSGGRMLGDTLKSHLSTNLGCPKLRSKMKLLNKNINNFH